MAPEPPEDMRAIVSTIYLRQLEEQHSRMRNMLTEILKCNGFCDHGPCDVCRRHAAAGIAYD